MFFFIDIIKIILSAVHLIDATLIRLSIEKFFLYPLGYLFSYYNSCSWTFIYSIINLFSFFIIKNWLCMPNFGESLLIKWINERKFNLWPIVLLFLIFSLLLLLLGANIYLNLSWYYYVSILLACLVCILSLSLSGSFFFDLYIGQVMEINQILAYAFIRRIKCKLATLDPDQSREFKFIISKRRFFFF